MRVSPITLVIFIVLSVFCLVGAYAFYSQQTGFEQKLEDADAKLKKNQDLYQAQVKELNDLLASTGYNADQLLDVTGTKKDAGAATTLDKILGDKIAARDELQKAVGVEITAGDYTLYLAKTIQDGLAAPATPADLKGTLVGNIIDALREAAKNQKDHQDVVAQGETKLKGLNDAIAQKEDLNRKTVAEWDDKLKTAWEKRNEQRDKLIADRKVWSAEEVELNKKLAQDKEILARVEDKLKAQGDMLAPADGKIIDYDWHTKRGSINLGSNNGIKTGYEFEVFRRYPGADTMDRRTYMAKVVVIEVKADVSLFALEPSDFDKAGLTMAPGDSVSNRLYNKQVPKHIYLAGYFPRGGDYDRDGLAGLVNASGNIVDDKLTLETDLVVVGVTDEGGIADWSPEAKASIAKAKADLDLATRYRTEVLSVAKLLSLIGHK